MRFKTVLLAAVLVAAAPCAPAAQELVPDTVTVMKARVLEVVLSQRQELPGLGVEATLQTLSVQVLDGTEKGKVLTVENDAYGLAQGDVFYLRHTINELDATDSYAVSEPYRLHALGILSALFVLTVLAFGGWQGARGLLSLAASVASIMFLLLPGILNGYPPVIISALVASFIVIVGSYVTHGFNRTTSVAVVGLVATVIVVAALAQWAVPFAQLSGFESDEATYLHVNTHGAIDFAGLLISGIMIGALGILYDAAIGQAVAIEELAAVGTAATRAEIFRRGLRIGREHIGALVNTLAIAYVGASLPLLLLFTGFSDSGFLQTINRDIFATELVRTILGSIGIVLAVPVTTLIAVLWLVHPGRIAAGRATTSPASSHEHRH
jgi:uncharacterized membrane protein